ncbi:putative metal tolerance protein 3 [Lipomyces japonicus]|uniref:putative metal tolerance protein 3 n=1 Tax=Lipomyces japonicus TaxID=56871 RepID=UPI0034CD2829
MDDYEMNIMNSSTRSSDPMGLASKVKTESEIQTLAASSITSRHTGSNNYNNNNNRSHVFGWSSGSRRGHRQSSKKLQDFYRSQNENITRMLKPVSYHHDEHVTSRAASNLKYKIAVHGSLTANLILSGLQLYGAVSSGSLSIFTTMADSIFDPVSNLLLILSHRAVQKVDPKKFPSGKARIETAGNITFSFLMCAVSLVLVVVSLTNLVEGSSTETLKFHLPATLAVAIAFGTKLALFLYCFVLRNEYSQVRILWEDHRNDLLINGFGILTSVGGAKLKWWIDPLGAILLSLIIILLWSRTAWTEFQLLIGVSADAEMLQLVTYMAMTHSPLILQVDTVRAFHAGPRIIVEVDVVMDRQETLQQVHDVSEELQIKFESLPSVERAYVHVDYETTHKPEHSLKKDV